MIVLYDNPFSPFARKVRMVLFSKNLEFESIDGLELSKLDELGTKNPRREVPVLLDEGVCVVNSADIVAYLDHRYGPPLVLPGDPAVRVAARAWERLSDSVVDAILHDASIWMWPTHKRTDAPPDGLVVAVRRDLAKLLRKMEDALAAGEFLCGDVSIADLALYPHVSSLRLIGLPVDSSVYPRVRAWLARLRALSFVQRDIEVVRRGVDETLGNPERFPYETEKIVWRGDRLEWLFVNGFHDWWADELAAGCATVPASL